MNLMRRLRYLIQPDRTQPQAAFTLGDRGERPPEETAEARRRLREAALRAELLTRRLDRLLDAGAGSAAPGAGAGPGAAGDLTASLTENLERLKLLFRAPDNADLIIRRFRVGTHPPVEAALVFLEGMADKGVINASILQPLMLLAHLDHHLDHHPGGPGAGPPEDGGQAEDMHPVLRMVLERLLPGNQAEVKPDLESIIEGILYGDSAVFLDGVPGAVVVDTKGFPLRGIDQPRQELVIRGPLDAFNESFRTNVALVRKRLKDPRLVTEVLKAGEVSRTFVGVCYLDGVANPKLVKEVKRRIQGLAVDVVPESGILEQLIEDQPLSVFPLTLTTERPDRASAYLAEGHVALFADNSPYALIVPVTWWSMLQTAEDYYIRWPYGSLLRWLRVGALLFTLLSGGLYVAAVNFHPEMIPTGLLLFIAGTRETVPFPAVVEILLMEIAFELVREAGIRIPSVIGPTLGIVGALILGQAAVEAGLFSPLVVVMVAAAGLASFAVPNYNGAYGLRALRYVFILLAAALGLYGLALGLLALVLHLTSLRSFGVPYLSPVAPLRRGSPDTLVRGPIFDMEERPELVRPVDRRRQPPVARRWDPLIPPDLRRPRWRPGRGGAGGRGPGRPGRGPEGGGPDGTPEGR